MGSFFSLLRYSFGNEDWRTEQEALQIQPNDRVLVITASGDRPLNLLVRPCKKIVSVDANPIQNNLLQLKKAAMQSLSYSDYLSFLGASAGSGRMETLNRLVPLMEAEAGKFWLSHKRMIEKGILYQGTVERLTSVLAKIFKLTRGKKIKRLFEIDCIEKQRAFLRDEWDGYFLKKAFNATLNSFLSKILIKDPGLVNYSSSIKPGDYIYDRMQASLERELAKKNPLLSLIFRGKVSPEAYSPYLTEEGTSVIKQRLHLIETHTTNILTFLESFKKPSFDAFSLSDVPSYLSYENFVRLLEGILKTAKPGARFCLRQFLSSYEVPPHLKPHFQRNTALEEKLEQMESCFVYRFMAGTIAAPIKNPALSATS